MDDGLLILRSKRPHGAPLPRLLNYLARESLVIDQTKTAAHRAVRFCWLIHKGIGGLISRIRRGTRVARNLGKAPTQTKVLENKFAKLKVRNSQSFKASHSQNWCRDALYTERRQR
jgi:hypothetical protein